MADSRRRGPTGFRLAHELSGLLAGVTADDHISQAETDRIRAWLTANHEFTDVHPFTEIAQHLEHALASGRRAHA